MVVSLLLAAAAASDNTRLFLFILVIVAVAFILAGGTIAMLVLIGQHKAQNPPEEAFGE